MFKFVCLNLMVIIALAKVPPVKKVSGKIHFSDDLNFENMVKAIDRHLIYFKNNKYMKVKFKLEDKVYTRKDLQSTMVQFKKIVNEALSCIKTNSQSECEESFSFKINESFDIFEPIPNSNEKGYETNQTRFTAYYSPSLQGSKIKTEIFKNPIYKRPKNEKLRTLSSKNIIFEDKLADKNLELFYVKDSLFDIWLLHVEGGGVVEESTADGQKKIHYLSYDKTNSQNFSMLSKYMLKEGMLSKDDRSVEAQRKFIEENPDKEEQIISSCRSYVYFKRTNTEPMGVRNIPLTMNRSLASDKKLFNEYGFISYIRLEDKKDIKINRFFINQDTGGAIKGNARADLYMGYGKTAKRYANNLHTLGKQYLLMFKKDMKNGK